MVVARVAVVPADELVDEEFAMEASMHITFYYNMHRALKAAAVEVGKEWPRGVPNERWLRVALKVVGDEAGAAKKRISAALILPHVPEFVGVLRERYRLASARRAAEGKTWEDDDDEDEPREPTAEERAENEKATAETVALLMPLARRVVAAMAE